MTARELLSAMAFALATGETPKSVDWYPDPRSFEAAVEAYRAEVLNEAADLIERVAFAEDGPATRWNWSDAATIPGSIAALLRQHAAPQPDTTKET